MSNREPNSSPEQEQEPMTEVTEAMQPHEEVPSRSVEPTRYGDWEKNGRCIDF